ncbi:putative Transposase-associated domain-containing protein [Helianthus annuus]|nr:putative Transposase-associated domain-containing protein [Helianthus annuus]
MDNRIKRLPEFFTVDQMGFGKGTSPNFMALNNAFVLCHTANSTPYHGSAKLLAETFYLFIQFKSQTRLHASRTATIVSGFSKVTSPSGQGNQFKDNFANSSAQDLDFAMPLGKSWTKITNKVDPVFINGAIAFAERGKTYVDSEGRIHCPCKKCVNARRHVPTVVADHIIYNGFDHHIQYMDSSW